MGFNEALARCLATEMGALGGGGEVWGRRAAHLAGQALTGLPDMSGACVDEIRDAWDIDSMDERAAGSGGGASACAAYLGMLPGFPIERIDPARRGWARAIPSHVRDHHGYVAMALEVDGLVARAVAVVGALSRAVDLPVAFFDWPLAELERAARAVEVAMIADACLPMDSESRSRRSGARL